MSRSHKTRNGQRAPHWRQLAWWLSRTRQQAKNGPSFASMVREWDERWPW